MAEALVHVEDVSKRFCRNLRRSLWYGVQDIWTEILRRPPPSQGALRENEFWGLQNVSFELQRGECLGLIGHNGAGKTTLLRMLSGLLRPDTGRIELRGRVGALISLGAGFHPVLTGRENIYVNGAILGLSKHAIRKKIDEIIEFSDLGDFIDAPVQSYSSGMTIRLGFSIAVKLIKPDVLLLDEVLAVGDEGFRAKCYDAIAGLRDHTAAVFVSHSMPAVQRMCSQVLVLEKGRAAFLGDTADGIRRYFRHFTKIPIPRRSIGTGEATVLNAALRDERNAPCSSLEHARPFKLWLELRVDTKYAEYGIEAAFFTRSQELVAQCDSRASNQFFPNDGRPCRMEIEFGSQLFTPGSYLLNLIVFDKSGLRHLCWELCLLEFEVTGSFTGAAPVQLLAKWQQLQLPVASASPDDGPARQMGDDKPQTDGEAADSAQMVCSSLMSR